MFKKDDPTAQREPLETFHYLKDLLRGPWPFSAATHWVYVKKGYLEPPLHLGKFCIYTDSYVREMQQRILDGTLVPSKNRLPFNRAQLAAQSNRDADNERRLAERNQKRRERERKKR